jgi:hypothetical protein
MSVPRTAKVLREREKTWLRGQVPADLAIELEKETIALNESLKRLYQASLFVISNLQGLHELHELSKVLQEIRTKHPNVTL